MPEKERRKHEMKYRMALMRCSVFMTAEELSRMHTGRTDDEIEVDLHGLSEREARRFLRNLIACMKTRFTIFVIHGYRHGTVIRNMVRSENREISHRVIRVDPCMYNPGATTMVIGEMAGAAV